MSYQANFWAWEQDVSWPQKLLLVALVNFANEDGVCYPSQERLATMTGLSERCIRDNLAQLEQGGLIERSRRYLHTRTGGRKPDAYRLLGLPALRAGKGAGLPAPDAGKVGGLPADGVPNIRLRITEEKKEKNLIFASQSSASKKQGRVKSRIPKDFTLSPEMKTYAMQQGVALPEVEFRKFREYYEAKGTVWLDWVKVWQIWCRNSSTHRNGVAVSPYGPPKPHEFREPISQEQRLENVRRLRELGAGIGK